MNLDTLYDRQRLVELIRRDALQFGDFVLASGRRASFYLDCKQVTLDAAGCVLVAAGMLELLRVRLPRAVGGMSIGADPITSAIVTLAGMQNLPLKGFMVRKEPKGHGTNRYIEGPVRPGDRVAIVEDVVTTGASSLEAIERCVDFGLVVERVVAIVDRRQGGAEAFRSRGYEFESLLSIEDLGITP